MSQQVPVFQEVIIRQANIQVVDLPGEPPSKAILFITPNGIQYSVPMPVEVAEEVGRMLTGSQLIIAKQPLPRNGHQH